ncbi:MAG TPA: branched-chain amino acid transaminase [Nitrososphaeraceae archaeon]|nr:branched-chain amino acid transaminase [Nitrososphaeraceae archaeon]
MNDKSKIWMDGKFVEWNNAKIHILTHGLHYGTAVFEGIRCYNTKRGPAIFRLEDHVKRLTNSCKMYHMTLEYSEKEISEAIVETIKINDVNDCYIRPICYYGYGKMGVNPLPNKVSTSIALWDWEDHIITQGTNGMRVMVSSWARIDSRSLPIHAKATANYANSALARIEAVKSGVDEAIMLNMSGMVVEGTAENIFMVKNKVLVTPPLTSGALDGITRLTVLSIAEHLGINFQICDIARDELYYADEVFLTGTAAEIKSIGEIDKIIIADGKAGEIATQLQNLYYQIVHGEIKKFEKWLTYIN